MFLNYLNRRTHTFIVKLVLVMIHSVCLANTLFAYTYGEHKEIGDKAFSRFVDSLTVPQEAALFLSYADAFKNDQNAYSFSYLTVTGGNLISYGVLNGLNGDHQGTPLEMEAQLRDNHSLLQRIISLHNEYIAKGDTAAPDGKLAKLDFRYVLLAAVNLSHFYEYKLTFQQQLRHFKKELIAQCEDPARAGEAFGKLGKTNAINMYVTIHTVAIDLAEQSGRLSKTNEAQARQLLRHALLYNSFADHFLEDAFSAGHLIVNRSVLASVTNNKALHDFYSENGTTVLNRNGEIWEAFGDGQLHRAAPPGSQAGSAPTTDNRNVNRIVEAVELSLRDVWNAFNRAADSDAYTPFLQTIPEDAVAQPLFLINAFPSLRLVPIPYNSQLETLFPNAVITPAMRNANQKLPYREFVRSRFSNAFVLSLNSTGASSNNYQGFEFRINAGNIGKKYSHNARGGKRGTLDLWNGYTAAYALGSVRIKEGGEPHTKLVSELRAGVRSNLDYWFTDKRFLGLYGYTEAGVQFMDGKKAFVFAPSIGLQAGSLFRVNYYNMPTWLRIPAEYFLPLKVRMGARIIPGRPTQVFSGLDLDFVF